MNVIRWYAARTLPRHEKKVITHLALRKTGAFLPVYSSPRRWNNRQKVNLELPLFPGYVFVRTSVERRVEVLSSPGVLDLVGCGKRPVPVPDAEIELLSNGIRNLNPEPHPYLKMGDLVSVRSGPLAGREGTLIRKLGNLRFVLSMDLLMKAISVEIDATDLEGIPVMCASETCGCRSELMGEYPNSKHTPEA